MSKLRRTTCKNASLETSYREKNTPVRLAHLDWDSLLFFQRSEFPLTKGLSLPYNKVYDIL